LLYIFSAFYASSKKHLILVYSFNNKYEIDIRLIDDPNKRIWFYRA